MTQLLTTESLRQMMPFGVLLGLEVISADPDTVVGSMRWDERFATAGGALHGGALMSLTDADGRPVTRTTQTQAVLAARPSGG